MSDSRPVRVLWLIRGLGAGGAERLLVSLASVLDSRVVDLTIAYVVGGETALKPALEARGLPVIFIGPGGPVDPRWPFRLRRLLDDSDYDIVHVHSPVAFAVLRGALAFRSRPRVVVTEHAPRNRLHSVTRCALAILRPRADIHLAVSTDTLLSLPRSVLTRSRTLRHGLRMDTPPITSTSVAQSRTRRELGVGDDEMVLLCVAGLRKEKGHADLLNAVSLLSEMGTPVRLLLAGSGPLEGQLRATRDQMGLQGRVVFLGLRDDVPDLLAAADLFVLASHFEGLPVAVMEALAAGKPVVATEVGGLPEAVANGVEGLLVPPSRPDRLAEAIARLVADPALRAQMAEAAQQRGATFDIALTARELETIYLDVASSARRVGDGPLHRRLLPKRHDST